MATTNNNDSEFLAVVDVADKFLDVCSRDDGCGPNRPPDIMLRAAGRFVCEVVLACKLDLDEALVTVGKEARDLEAECRELDEGEDEEVPAGS
jgi:hypothetical protein